MFLKGFPKFCKLLKKLKELPKNFNVMYTYVKIAAGLLSLCVF